MSLVQNVPELIEKQLQSLQSAFADQEHDLADAALVVIDGAVELVQSHEQAICMRLLLGADSPSGSLLKALQVVATLSGFEESRASIFNLVAKLYEHYGKELKTFSIIVLTACLRHIRLERKRTPREAAFKPLLSIIEHRYFDEAELRQRLPVEKEIISKLFQQVSGWSKLISDGVRKCFLHTLGLLASVFPEDFQEKQVDALAYLYVDKLAKEKKPSQIVEGVFVGLRFFFNEFSSKFSLGQLDRSNPLTLTNIFNYIRLALNPTTLRDASRYSGIVAVLNFLAMHASRFRVLLLRNALEVVFELQNASRYSNKDVSKASMAAFDTTVHQISVALLEEHSCPSEYNQAASNVFAKLVKHFGNMLNDASGHVATVSAGIRAFGIFAKCIAAFSGHEALSTVLNNLLGQCELFYARGTLEGSASSLYLPHFMSSIALALQELDEINEGMIACLAKLVERMMQSFPELYFRRRPMHLTAFMRLSVVLFSKGSDVFERLCRSAILNGVVLSIGPLPTSSTRLRPDGVPRRGWEEYAELWKVLLGAVPESQQALKGWKQSIDATLLDSLEDTQASLHELFLDALIKVISMLNLNIAASSETDADADAERPENERDFEIFLNLVELCVAVLPHVSPHLLPRRCLPLVELVNKLSADLPEISGFYKLQRVVLRVCGDADAFHDRSTSSPTQSLYSAFATALTSAIARVPLAQDELLFALLELVLGAPDEFVDVSSQAPALHRALSLGLSHAPCLDVALDAIEHWMRVERDRGALQRFEATMEPLLPLLLKYIGRVALVAQDAEQSALVEQVGVEDVTRMQRRVLLLLGRLSFNCSHVLERYVAREKVEFAWDSCQRVVVDLPFDEHTVHVHVDTLLPRVAELALASGQRHLKIAACEFLHAVTISMVAANARDPRRKSTMTTTPFGHIYRHLLPVLLLLATDIDSVATTLFRTLTMQLVHWFSDGISTEKDALLDALLDAVCDASNASLRAFGADCIAEFFRWSLKHAATSPSASASAMSLLRRLCSLCSHPNADKRLGACVGFGCMYRAFREDVTIVSQYTLDVITHLLRSVELSATDDAVVEAAEKALQHYIRVIVDPRHGFLKRLQALDATRVGQFTTLDELREFLLRQLARPERVYRRLCCSVLQQLGDVQELLQNELPSLESVCAFAEAQQQQQQQPSLGVTAGALFAYNFCFRHGRDAMLHENALIIDAIKGFVQQQQRHWNPDRETADTSDAFVQLGTFITTLPASVVKRLAPLAAPLVDVVLRRLFALAPASMTLTCRLLHTLSAFTTVSISVTPLTSVSTLLSRVRETPPLVSAYVALLKDELFTLDVALRDRLLNELVLAAPTLTLSQLAAARSLLHLVLRAGADALPLLANEVAAAPFRDVLHRHLLSAFERYATTLTGPTLRRTLVTFVEAVLREAKASDASAMRVCTRILQDVPHDDADADADATLLELRTLYAIACWNASWFARRDQPWLERVQTLLERCLAPGAAFVLKERAVVLLRFILVVGNPTDITPSVPDDVDDRMCTAVTLMTASAPFPLRSMELDRRSTTFSAFSALLQALLDALVFTRSRRLLTALLACLRERKHACADVIDASLGALCRALLCTHEALGFALFSIDLLLSPTTDPTLSHAFNARAFVGTSLCVPLLSLLPLRLLRQAWTQRGAALWRKLQQPLPEPSHLFEHELCYRLLAVVASRLPRDDLKEALEHCNCRFRDVVSLASQHCTRQLASSDEMVLNFHAAAYECLVATVCASQTKVDVKTDALFARFCFGKGVAGLWDCVVSPDAKFFFFLETDFKPASRGVIAEAAAVADDGGDKTRRVYVGSQYLVDSSLSAHVDSVRSLALLRATQDVATASNDDNDDNDDSSPVDDANDAEVVDRRSLAELDALNSLPAMKPFVRVVAHLHRQFGNVSKGENMPVWAETLLTALDSSSPIVVRLFVLKLIVNVPFAFERFARRLFPALLDVLLDPSLDAVGFHYLLRDVCCMFLAWKSFGRGVDATDASRLIAHLLACVHDYGQLADDVDERRGKRYSQPEVKLRHNITVLKALVERFVSAGVVLRVCKTPLAHLLNHLENTSDVVVALQSLGVLVANDVPEYDVTVDDVAQRDFCTLLMRSLRADSTRVYRAAAELLGLMLARRLRQPHVQGLLTPAFMNELDDFLVSLFGEARRARFLETLRLLSAHDHAFVSDTHLSKLLQIALGARSTLQSDAVQLLIAHADRLGDAASAHLQSLLQSAVLQSNENVHRSVLGLALALCGRLNVAELEALLPRLIAVYASSRDSVCRAALYRILVWLLAHHDALLANASVRQLAERALLSAFGDSDSGVRDMAFSFFSEGAETVQDVLPALLKRCYSETVEPHFLFVVSSLLLQRCVKSPRLAERLSNAPLNAQAHVELAVDGTWRPDASKTVPKFAANTQSQSQPQLPVVAATQTPAFTLTQQMLSATPHESLDLSAKLSQAAADSRVFRLGRRPAPAAAAGDVQDRFRELGRRRFDMTRQSDVRDASIKLFALQQRYADAMERRLRAAASKNVRVLRHYRAGELPDIEIERRDLIMPLLALQADSELAKRTFALLLNALLPLHDRAEVADALMFVLTQVGALGGEGGDRRFFTALTLACIDAGAVAFASDALVASARRANAFEGATLLLEHRLLHHKHAEEQERKRARVHHVDDERVLTALTRCYAALGDDDVLIGVFERICSSNDAKLAFSLSVLGAHDLAVSSFRAVLDRDPPTVSDAELDVCEDGFMDALVNLGRWSDVHDTILGDIGHEHIQLLNRDHDLFKDNEWLRLSYLSRYLSSLRVVPAYAAELTAFLEVADRAVLTHDAQFQLLQCDATVGAFARVEADLCVGLDRFVTRDSFVRDSASLDVLRVYAELDELVQLRPNASDVELDALVRGWVGRHVDATHTTLFVDVISNRLSALGILIQQTSSTATQEALFAHAQRICRKAAGAALAVQKLGLVRHFVERGLGLDTNDVSMNVLRLRADLQRALRDHEAPAVLKIVDQLDDIDVTCVDDSSHGSKKLLMADALSSVWKLTGDEEVAERARVAFEGALSAVESAEALLQFGLFCADRASTALSTAVTAVSHVLKAMRLGLDAAIEAFPRVLDLVSDREAVVDALCDGANVVPAWMFLRWTAQMLAQLGVSRLQRRAVLETLTRMAHDYPQALFFPFAVTRSDLASSQVDDDDVDAAVARLDGLLRLPQLEFFSRELAALAHPELLFKDLVSSCKTAIQDGDVERVSALRADFFASCIDSKRTPVTKSFARRYGATIRSALSKLESLARKRDVAGFEGAVTKVLDNIRSRPLSHGLARLEDFSPALASYQRRSSDSRIELPGQYTGRELPQPDLHADIVSFDPSVRIMPSIRRPFRISLRCNDEKEHRFLVKSGEDLRLDERVEQMFHVMNCVFADDAACSKRSLNVETFPVVPVSNRLGLIGWIDDSEPLLSVLERQYGRSFSDVLQKHVQFLGKASGSRGSASIASMHLKLLSKAVGGSIEREFAKLECLLPPDLLVRALMSLCTCHESYLQIRSQFNRSFSVLSVCLYVLGIGDRHLSNWLLSLSSGRLIAIDFGLAFDQGVQLPIPELIPIRFSRQFQRLMRPLDSRALVQQTMAHAMNALRQNHERVLSVMSVFVKEPHLDWINEAKERSLAMSSSPRLDSESESAVTRWIQRKLDVVSKKLLGYSSVHVMLAEIDTSVRHSKQSYVPCLRALVEGRDLQTAGKAVRARRQQFADGPLRVDEQIECLVSHASDPAILARTWQGWMPFV